jgi:hypothetical protein
MNDFASLFLKLPISDSKSYFSSLDNLLSKNNEKLNNDAFNLLIDTLKEYLFNSPFNEPERAEHVFDNSAFDKLQSDYRNELDEILLIKTDELNLKIL